MDSLIKLIWGAAVFVLLFAGLLACSDSSKNTVAESAAAGAGDTATTVVESISIFSSRSSAGGYQKLSAAEAQARMDSGDPIVIVDVRTPEEYAEGYITGAINLPLDQIGHEAATVLPDKDAEILVYCRSGNRSQTASQILVGLGYSKIYDFGGIIDWTGSTEKP